MAIPDLRGSGITPFIVTFMSKSSIAANELGMNLI